MQTRWLLFVLISLTFISARHSVVSCKCGLRFGNRKKILGGRIAPDNGDPWAVALVRTENNGKVGRFCGGSVISDQYVLTAAHCLGSPFKISLGGNLSNIRDVERAFRHPSFNTKTLDNDMALVKLREKMSFTQDVRPICLPQKGQTFAGRGAKVVGWGVTKQNAPNGVKKLREVAVKILDNGACNSLYSKSGVRITQNMLCASGGRGKDSCSGDSGGPLAIVEDRDKKPSAVQVGVVSYGIGCGDEKHPGVYARVTRYLKWIADNTQDSTYCS